MSKQKIVVRESPSSSGLSIMASSGPERKPMVARQDQSIVDWVETGWRRYVPFMRYTTYHCGHRGPASYEVRIWGIELQPAKSRRLQQCPDCGLKELKETTIRCCLCGFPILKGEEIAVYDAESVQPKDYEFKVVEGYALGCMRWDCCPTGGFFAGTWNGKTVDWLYNDSKTE